jgi:hypothetical protein
MGSDLDKSRASNAEPAVRYEPRDVPPFLPFWLACLIGGFVALVLIVITLGFPLADRQEYRGPLQRLPPAPRLEIAPVAQRLDYDAAKRKELQTSPIPIEAAMQATANEGWGPPR